MLLEKKHEVTVNCGDSKQEMQEALSSSCATNNEQSIHDRLADLQKRLSVVQSWGGAYSQIEFSPDIEAMLSRKSIVIKDLSSPKEIPATRANSHIHSAVC